MADWLVTRELSTGARERWPVAALAPLLGAVLVSGGFAGAWVPVAPYVLLIMSVGPRSPGTAWWTWPVQPWASQLAVWSAVTLLILGGAAYSWSGARPVWSMTTTDRVRRRGRS